MRVEIEVGGTFTDLLAVDGACVEVVKVPGTAASPDAAHRSFEPAACRLGLAVRDVAAIRLAVGSSCGRSRSSRPRSAGERDTVPP